MGVAWNDKGLRDLVGTEALKFVEKACVAIERDAKQSMGNAGPFFTKGGKRRAAKRAERHANRSRPGEPPHVDTGTLRRSVTFEIEETKDTVIGRVGTNLRYGRFLETGTYKMAARPYLRPAFNRYIASRRAG